MYMCDFNLRELELQLYGYDAALGDTGLLGEYERFNFSFSEYLRSNYQISCARGWANAITEKSGTPEQAFISFQEFMKSATIAA